MRQTLIHAVARVTLAAIFTYHGLVPKLLNHDTDEIAMLTDAGISMDRTGTILTAIGFAELAFAATLLTAWRRRWPAAVSIGIMLLATATVAVHSPRFFTAAFNPFSLNLAVASLAVIDFLALDRLPSASRCLRRPPAHA